MRVLRVYSERAERSAANDYVHEVSDYIFICLAECDQEYF